jgi:hypothetical protein
MQLTQAWVEVHLDDRETLWSLTINALPFLSKNESLVTSLFGGGPIVVDFHPVVPTRTLPPDASPQVKGYFEQSEAKAKEALVSSWMSWQEASTINWNEPDTLPERRLLRCPLAGGGNYVGETQAEGISWLAKESGHTEAEVWSMWQPGIIGGYGHSIYRVEGKRRKDLVDEGWKLLSASLAFLGRAYGDTSVRLLVGWFHGD